VNGITGVANGFDYEQRLDPLRAFGKEEHSRQVEHSIFSSQAHVLQQSHLLRQRVRKILIICLAQKIPKAQLIQLLNSCLGGQLIGMKLVGELKQPS